MGRRLIKMACCYRLKKLANVAGYIQRFRLQKVAFEMLPGGPEAQREFENNLAKEFAAEWAKDGETVVPMNMDSGEGASQVANTGSPRYVSPHRKVHSGYFGEVYGGPTGYDFGFGPPDGTVPSASGTPVVAADTSYSRDTASDGVPRLDPPVESDVPKQPTPEQQLRKARHYRFQNAPAAKDWKTYNDMMLRAAKDVYGTRWRNLTSEQKKELSDRYAGMYRFTLEQNPNAGYYIPKVMKEYGMTPSLQNGLVLEPPEQQQSSPDSGMVASRTALGTTSDSGKSTSGVGVTSAPAPRPLVNPVISSQNIRQRMQAQQSATPSSTPGPLTSVPEPQQSAIPPQQAYQRTQPRQQNYVFNGPVARRIRARNGGPVFNGPIAQGMRARFGRRWR